MAVPFTDESFAAFLKAQPILWNPSCQPFKSVVARKKAWADIACKFIEENVTGEYLKDYFAKVRTRIAQRKRRQKVKGKSGAAGGEGCLNVGATTWGFLEESGRAFLAPRESSIALHAGPAPPAEDDGEEWLHCGDDEEDGEEDEDADLDGFQTGGLPCTSMIIIPSVPAVAVENCSAAAHAAYERLEEEQQLRRPPPDHAPGMFVLSPHGRRHRGVPDPNVPEAVPGTSRGTAPVVNTTPQCRPVRPNRGQAASRYSPSDYESDGASSTAAVASARARKARRRAISPRNMSVVLEDMENGDILGGTVDDGEVAEVTGPVNDEEEVLRLRDGADEDLLGDLNQSPRAAGGASPPPQPANNQRGGRGGGRLRPRGGLGRGAAQGQQRAAVHEADPQGHREPVGHGNAGLRQAGVTAAQRLQQAYEARRLAGREIIRAQQRVAEERRERQRRGRGNHRGGAHGDLREQLQPDDPRRLDTTAEVALLQQFLTEKEMDAFGHFGQSVACQLRQMRPARSGRCMIDIMDTLHQYNLLEDDL